jgi:cell division protein FtsQ
MRQHFPGLIEVQIQEFPVVALEWSEREGWSGLLSNGAAIPYQEVPNITSLPILSGWEDQVMKANLCQVLSEIPSHLLNDISEIRPIPSNSYGDRIKMYTRSKFEVISRISYLHEKIELLDDYVYETINEGRTGGRIVMMETNYWQTLEIPSDQETDGKMNSSSP